MIRIARSLLVGALLAVSVAAQEQGERSDAPQDDKQVRERLREVSEKWLASEHTDRDLLTATVRAVLEQPDVGLPWLGGLVPAIEKAPSAPRSKGARELLLRVTLEFLRRQHKSEMVFVGQYDPLQPLQPLVGELLFDLLLETPEWYPFTFRVRLVPALRDLQPRIPGARRLDAIIEMTNDTREPHDLRKALAAMLAQWGRGEYAAEFVRELQTATTEGDGEDRVTATLQLADYYCLLRDYESSARAHRSAQMLAKASDVPLNPVAFYAAACVYALLGDKEKGMDALRRCAEMHASPHLDKSLRLERKLFEKDPEIRLLRADPEFAELMKLAFGDEPNDKSEDKTPEDNRR